MFLYKVSSKQNERWATQEEYIERLVLYVTVTIQFLKCILFLLSDHVEIFYEDGEYVLEIYDTEISDKGLYKCVAKNEVGSAETQCILTLRGKSCHLLFMFNRL